MKTKIIGGRVLRADGRFDEQCALWIENETIVAIGTEAEKAAADQTVDAKGLMLLPGLVDVHSHGRIGFDFCDATAEQMLQMKRDYAKNGVTSVFATLASGTNEEWLRAIADIEACGFDGIHLEGRYLNPKKRGAHNPSLLVPLDANELEGFLKEIHIPCHISAAFELDADGSFTARALQYGATLGLGHTTATAEEARLALSRGVTAFTHLYNTMPPLHHRDGGVIAVALLDGGYGELIADGMHICPDMIKLAFRCLGKEHTVLITDSMAGTGCPDGRYSIAGQPVIVENGKALTEDGALAGSTLNLWDGVKNLMRFASIPLEDAILCATANPARMVGIDGKVGSLETGKRADILFVDDSLALQRVLFKGEFLDQ